MHGTQPLFPRGCRLLDSHMAASYDSHRQTPVSLPQIGYMGSSRGSALVVQFYQSSLASLDDCAAY